MQTTSLFRRAAALALTLVLAVSASLAGFAAYDMPIQTVSDTESVYLFNLDTGKPVSRLNTSCLKIRIFLYAPFSRICKSRG